MQRRVSNVWTGAWARIGRRVQEARAVCVGAGVGAGVGGSPAQRHSARGTRPRSSSRADKVDRPLDCVGAGGGGGLEGRSVPGLIYSFMSVNIIFFNQRFGPRDARPQ